MPVGRAGSVALTTATTCVSVSSHAEHLLHSKHCSGLEQGSKGLMMRDQYQGCVLSRILQGDG